MFSTYFELGFDHILDPKGFDHILFILALCAIYSIRDFKKILILVTAFTIGHCITLVLSSLQWVNIDSNLVEFLIPLTILITAIYNVIPAKNMEQSIKVKYGIALLFGLIHGLGFSNFFKALMGKETNIVQQLLAFNLGVEAGQIVIVCIALLCSYIVVDILGAKPREWNLFVSGAAAGIAVTLMIA